MKLCFNFFCKNLLVISFWGVVLFFLNSLNFERKPTNFTLEIKSQSQQYQQLIDTQTFNIFFIESNPNNNDRDIGFKELCAIESAARHNPEAKIQVYTLGAQLNSNASILFDEFQNINIIPLNLETVSFTNNRILLGLWKTCLENQTNCFDFIDFLRFFLVL